MRDYYAILRVQQGRLRAAMQERGIQTGAELARRSGVSTTDIYSLLNFRRSPRTKTGKWNGTAILVCRALGYEPSELFPAHLDHEVATNCVSSFVDYAQLAGCATPQLGPDRVLQRAEAEQDIADVMGALTDRERAVLYARFWDGKVLREVGRELNLCTESARQIERKALCKLRNPARLRKLEGVLAAVTRDG